MAEYGILTILFALFLYFIPTIIAVSNKKSNAGAIFVLNLFLGWTFLGWIIALVWSLSKDKDQSVIINNMMPEGGTHIYSHIIPNQEQHYEPVKEISSPTMQDSLQPHTDKINQLKELKELYDSEILTQQEFNEQKSKILQS